MSKEAAVRAMREARYAERAKRSAGEPAAVRPALRPAKAQPTEPAPAAEPAGDALCGHRSMNGRTCTREHGHVAKNHRYS